MPVRFLNRLYQRAPLCSETNTLGREFVEKVSPFEMRLHDLPHSCDSVATAVNKKRRGGSSRQLQLGRKN